MVLLIKVVEIPSRRSDRTIWWQQCRLIGLAIFPQAVVLHRICDDFWLRLIKQVAELVSLRVSFPRSRPGRHGSHLLRYDVKLIPWSLHLHVEKLTL